jgi:RNA polymerase sigma factor (sigma-70 family)
MVTIMTPEHADTLKTRPTLLSKVRRGDEAAWTEFYELYQRFFYSAARAAGLSHEESQEVVQDVMVGVQKYIGQFVPDLKRARFRTWLRQILRSRIADQYRRRAIDPSQKATAQPVVSEEFATSTTDRIPDPREIDLGALIDRELEQAILTEARKVAKEKVRMQLYQAYDLFHVQELSARDVATSLGISVVTVRVWAFRVRRVIEQEIRRIIKRLDRPTPALKEE